MSAKKKRVSSCLSVNLLSSQACTWSKATLKVKKPTSASWSKQRFKSTYSDRERIPTRLSLIKKMYKFRYRWLQTQITLIKLASSMKDISTLYYLQWLTSSRLHVPINQTFQSAKYRITQNSCKNFYIQLRLSSKN